MKITENTSGVIAALGISVTAAIALPLVNIFKSLQPSELMIVRGSVTAVLVGSLLSRHIRRPSAQLLKATTLFAGATLALYAGIRAWGAGPTLVILTTTPFVNIVAKSWRGEIVNSRVYASLCGLTLGVMVALNPWQTTFDLAGFLYSVTATVLSGLAFEMLGNNKGLDPYNKTFWLAIVTAVIGLVATLIGGHIPFATETWTVSRILALIGFGATGGFLYYLAIAVAFEKLKTEVASTLAMAETPAVIIGSYIILGERLTFIQWIGVAVALLATGALSASESDSNKAS